jgi:ABC-type bacteriocin/lantibiotic exporter with double-glycine peptidase domain
MTVDPSLAAIVRLLAMRTPAQSERQVLEVCGGDTSLEGAAAAARVFGALCRVVQVTPVELSRLSTPTLLEMSDGTLALMRRVRRRAVEIDSPRGPIHVTAAELAERFGGRALDFSTGLAEGATAARRMLLTALENRRGLAYAIGASVLVQLLGVIAPQFTRLIIDRALPNAASSLLSIAAIGVVFVAVFQALFEWLRQRSMIYFEARSGLVFESGFLRHVIRLPYGVLSTRTTGQLLQSFSSITPVRDVLATRGLAPVIYGVLAVVYLSAIAALMPSIASLVAIGGLVIALAGAGAALLQARLSRFELNAATAENTLLLEAIGNVSTIKAAAAERQTMLRWIERLHTREFYTLARQRVEWISSTAVDALQQVVICGMLFWGGTLVLRGSLTAGSMIAAVQLIMGFLASTTSLITGVVAFINAAPQWERVADVLDEPAPREHRPAISRRLEGPVVLDHVSFRYSPNGPWVLKDFSLRIEANERLSLSARSGWGKSTILRLVAGLYEPERGSITIGGVQPKIVREQIGYLPQFTTPIAGSIINALRFFSGNARIEHLLEVSADTGLHEWVRTLPMSYETMLPTRGETVSGGQRQLIALTGILASDRPILLLDEFVACLDAPARARVLQSRFLENRTIILADHVPADATATV